MTYGKNDTKVTVSQESADEIKFQVPQMKPGRCHLSILTANHERQIGEPVVLTVE